MAKKNLFVNFYALQTLPPSCVNRDDTGSPKSAIYGGQKRLRVSKQAFTHEMGAVFRDTVSKDNIGFRTRHLRELLSDEIKKQNSSMSDEDVTKLTEKVLKMIFSKSKNSGESEESKDVMFFISSMQVKALASKAIEYASDNDKDKDKKYTKEFIQALIDNPSIDMMLFGRMSASESKLTYDAASSMSHAISTHVALPEFDFYTAVDDCNPEDETGGGHIGTSEFSSATIYRYANINVMELVDKYNVGVDEVNNAVRGYADAFVRALPRGREHAFAANTLPYFIYVTVNEKQPVNFATAFECPIKESDEGYQTVSEKALIDEAKSFYGMYGSMKPVASWICGKADSYDLAPKVTFEEMLDKLANEVCERIK